VIPDGVAEWGPGDAAGSASCHMGGGRGLPNRMPIRAQAVLKKPQSEIERLHLDMIRVAKVVPYFAQTRRARFRPCRNELGRILGPGSLCWPRQLVGVISRVIIALSGVIKALSWVINQLKLGREKP
jgi:hypothetical protein